MFKLEDWKLNESKKCNFKPDFECIFIDMKFSDCLDNKEIFKNSSLLYPSRINFESNLAPLWASMGSVPYLIVICKLQLEHSAPT